MLADCCSRKMPGDAAARGCVLQVAAPAWKVGPQRAVRVAAGGGRRVVICHGGSWLSGLNGPLQPASKGVSRPSRSSADRSSKPPTWVVPMKICGQRCGGRCVRSFLRAAPDRGRSGWSRCWRRRAPSAAPRRGGSTDSARYGTSATGAGMVALRSGCGAVSAVVRPSAAGRPRARHSGRRPAT